MKTIKFRAWTGKVMVDCAPMVIGTLNKSDDPIMQFTGLLDKNGKEIYEGDILGNYWWGETTGTKNAVVEWDDNFTGFTVLKTMIDTVTNPELEVIGNIYENPELILAEST